MKYLREIVHSPKYFEQYHLSSKLIGSSCFKAARVKEGGYGIHDSDFWVERISSRGFFVVVLTLSGKGMFTMEDGSVLTVSAGEAFISSPTGQGHREETTGSTPWEHIWITFHHDAPRFMNKDFDYRIVPFTNGRYLKSSMVDILDEDMYHDSFSPEIIDHYEHVFMLNIERVLSSIGGSDLLYYRERFARLWSDVSKTIYLPWSVEDMCNYLNYSRSQLTRICNALYNSSPGQKVKELKMDYARLLLINSTKSVNEVASDVGYKDISTFSSAFSAFFGESPSDMRKKGREEA